MFEYAELLCAGVGSFFIGILSALIGLGGGFLLVPMYTLIFGISPEIAIGTSITTTICTALSATLFRIHELNVHRSVIFSILIASIPAAIIGVYSTSYLSGAVLTGIFGVFLILIAIRLIVGSIVITNLFFVKLRQIPEDEPTREKQELSRWYLLLTGGAGGFISGLTGISGGIIFVPALIRRNVLVQDAVIISLASIIFTSAGAAFWSMYVGNVNFPLFYSSAIGVIFGAGFGVKISPYFSSGTIRLILGVSVGSIALVMILKAFSMA